MPELPFDPWYVGGWVAAAIIAGVGAWKGVSAYFKSVAEDKYGDPETVRLVTRLDEQIHEALTQLREQCHASRVMVFLFHNGEQFFSGSPIQRMTCSYETVQGGISSVTADSQSMVVSLMSAVLDRMRDDTPLIWETSNIPKTFSRTRLETLNVKYFACLPLRQNKHKIIGLLKMHWMHKDEIQIDEAGETWLKGEMLKTVGKIEHLLARRLEVSGAHS
jgi:hypothetical protein